MTLQRLPPITQGQDPSTTTAVTITRMIPFALLWCFLLSTQTQARTRAWRYPMLPLRTSTLPVPRPSTLWW